MTAAELAMAGSRIYGEHWRAPLAMALGVGPRTLQRWASGRNPIPDNIAVNVNDLVDIAFVRGREKKQ
jgi:hypothetical protein